MNRVKQFLDKHFYLIIGILIIGMVSCLLLYRLGDMPAGLLASESKYGEAASRLWQTHQIETSVNLPWLVLEAAAIGLLGASPFSLRLPAAVCAILASGLIIYLSSKLTKRRAAASFGALLAVTSMTMLNLGRHAEPWSLMLLLLLVVLWTGHRVLNHRGGLVIGAVALALLASMTGGIVLCVCLLLVAILHPCLRLCLAKHHGKVVTGAAIGIILLVAFTVLSVQTETGLGELLGNFKDGNLLTFGQDLIGIGEGNQGGLVTPLTTIAGLTLAVLGIITLCVRSSFSIRSYLTVGLAVTSVVLGGFAPDFVWLMILPLWLAQTVALDEIIDRWYTLFPQNPYPRVLAAIPLVILVSSLALNDCGRYVGTINYSSQVAYRYNYDLAALINVTNNDDKYYVVAPEGERTLLDMARGGNVQIVPSVDDASEDGQIVLLGGAKVPSGYRLQRVETSWLSRDYVVARLYSK